MSFAELQSKGPRTRKLNLGEPQLLIPNLNVGAGKGITSDGTLYYSVRVNRQRLKFAELDMKTGELLSDPVNVTERFVGSNFGGRFSPDGETLAYFSERRGWQQQTLAIQSLRTGAEWDSPFTLQLSRDLRRSGDSTEPDSWSMA